MSELDAVYAFACAFALAAALTPLAALLARRVGAVEQPKARGLGREATPLLGGLAMLAAVLITVPLFLQTTTRTHDRITGILIGGVVITFVGAVDDRFDLSPLVKLLGQIAAAVIPVVAGVKITNITVPLLHPIAFGHAGAPVTVVGLVAMMNVVNFSDGVDGLAAGVCTIAAVAFAVIAFDLDRSYAAILAACTGGAAAGFLVHNFPPASIYMGDTGANLLGFLLGCVAVEGAVKTQAVLALGFPLVVLAVPFLDTTFVVLKRMKYRRPVYEADANHFHHRFSRIGFSERRTLVYLYAWTLLLGGFAVGLRFIPYSDHHGHLHTTGSIEVGALALVVLAASFYLVYVLEILKLRRISAIRLRRLRPDASESDVDAHVQEQMETGEFSAVDED